MNTLLKWLGPIAAIVIATATVVDLINGRLDRMDARIDKRLERIEVQLSSLRRDMSSMQKDVGFLKGHIAPTFGAIP